MASEQALDSLIFVGFNSQVVALDRYSGEVIWSWRASDGSGYPCLLLDGDRLIVSVQGYTYCLDPIFGQEVWKQPLKGMGIGVPCIASVRGGSTGMLSSANAKLEIDRQSAASASTTAATTAAVT